MKMKNLLLLVAALSIFAVTPAATAEQTICKVTFKATLNGYPALKPTRVTIRQDGIIVMESATHSFNTTSLECGKTYVATISTDVTPQQTVTRTRTFTVLIANRVFVAMDPK